MIIFLACIGYVFGGDVLRLYHGDECLTIPAHDVESAQRSVISVQYCTLIYGINCTLCLKKGTPMLSIVTLNRINGFQRFLAQIFLT